MTRLTEIAADICSAHSSYGMSGKDEVRGLLGLRMTRKAERTQAELILLKGPPMANSRVQEAMARTLRRCSEVPQTQAKEDSTARVAATRRVVVLERPGAHYRPR